MGKGAKPLKMVVFDMDETIGAFTALSRDLNQINPHLQNYALIKYTLDTTPTYLRPHMMEILRQVHAVKTFDPDLKVVLYTNNSNTVWIRFILHYINTFLNLPVPLFDHVLDASRRTSLDKNVPDLFERTQCKLKKNQQCRIFFVDDQYHPNMVHKDVVYFHITPYAEQNPGDVHASRLLYHHLREFMNG